MPEIRKTTAHPTKLICRHTDLERLRRVWRQAAEEESPGVPAAEVLDRLERKYRAIAVAQRVRGKLT